MAKEKLKEAKRQYGFTLIEMLIVIAVIGILSSVLLTALGPARDKAKDSRIVQEVNQVRNLAETMYSNGSYNSLEEISDGTLINNPSLKALADDITTQGGALRIIKSTPQGAKAYSTYSKLNVQAGAEPNLETQYYCVDSSGRAGFAIEEPLESRCPF
ncbi:MAG: type II secretion system protein [Patescibacteria group bacterium]